VGGFAEGGVELGLGHVIVFFLQCLVLVHLEYLVEFASRVYVEISFCVSVGPV
jgi:hypothetical protein